ncbi:MAG: class 1 isoprenoid biosynthesis enzyme [Phycisphaerae bacterium]|nr:class 1 isoprenoid biosynthesis enzyme [Phycisphaerae bacterium]
MSPSPPSLLLADPRFGRAFQLQVQAAREFHARAADIAGDECPIGPLDPDSLRVERNFFSTLFLAVTDAMVPASRYLPLYAMVNQAMRAWVTACDNVLDDEYKEIFPFTAAGQGRRMRSVLTLLLADRVLVEFALDRFGDAQRVRQIGRRSLAALVPSAVQESEEEQRDGDVAPVELVLEDIHNRKTGDLFVAPLAVPIAIESQDPARADAAKTALRQFGLACQVLDDINDLPDDLRAGRHNLLASILAHRLNCVADLGPLRRLLGVAWSADRRFPEACELAWELAADRFARSFDNLELLGLPLVIDDRRQIVNFMCHLLRVSPPARLWPMERSA